MDISTFLKYVEELLGRGVLYKIVLILALVGFFIYQLIHFLFYAPVSEQAAYFRLLKGENKTSLTKIDSLLYHKGEPGESMNYVKVHEKIPITGNGFFQARKVALNKSLVKADSLLLRNNKESYGKFLYGYINHGDELSKLIIDELFRKYILYINEEITEEDDTSYYSLDVSLEKNAAQDVKDIISFASDTKCLDRTMDNLIFAPLKMKGIVEVTLYEIYNTLSLKCPSANKVRQMHEECSANDCDNIYFERGQYDLSMISKMILFSFNERLQQQKSNTITVEFHGYTDEASFKSEIPYNGNAFISKKGTLINESNSSNVSEVNGIKNNDELSFVRAYNCYRFVQDHFKGQMKYKFYYTGWGVNQKHVSDKERRSVLVIVKNKEKANMESNNLNSLSENNQYLIGKAFGLVGKEQKVSLYKEKIKALHKSVHDEAQEGLNEIKKDAQSLKIDINKYLQEIIDDQKRLSEQQADIINRANKLLQSNINQNEQIETAVNEILKLGLEHIIKLSRMMFKQDEEIHKAIDNFNSKSNSFIVNSESRHRDFLDALKLKSDEFQEFEKGLMVGSALRESLDIDS